MSETIDKDVIVGIDPGFTGAIAILEGESLTLHDMPIHRINNKRQVDAKKLLDLLSPYVLMTKYVVIEDVHSMPGQGVSSTFKFGFNAGILHGVVSAMGLSIIKVVPSVWKSALNLSKVKRESLLLAIKLFPENKDQFRRLKDDGRAEAALMAEYVRRAL